MALQIDIRDLKAYSIVVIINITLIVNIEIIAIYNFCDIIIVFRIYVCYNLNRCKNKLK